MLRFNLRPREIEYTITIGNIISVFSVFIATIIAIWRISKMQKSLYSNGFKILLDIIQSEKVIAARKFIFENSESVKKITVENWPIEFIEKAEIVCRTYDAAGIMLTNGLIPKKIIPSYWKDSINKSYLICQPLILKYRKDRSDESFWIAFEELYRKKFYV